VVGIAACACGRVGFDPTAGKGDAAAHDAATTPDAPCVMPPELTQGLVGWWTFDEGSGTIAHDLAKGNDGLLIGGATWAPGHSGGAIALDGTTGHVDISGSAVYATHDAAFSFSAWANLTSWNTGTPDIMQMATDASASPFHCLWSDDPNYDGLSTGDGDGSWIPTKSQVEPTLATWHHVAMVYSGGGAKTLSSFTYYLDGVVQPLVEAAGYATQVNVSRIGAAEVPSNNWIGLIDDVRIYDHALNAAEVSALAALSCD
jgi:hypothetical protein